MSVETAPSELELNDKQTDLVRFLKRQAEKGNVFFKSKYISRKVGMTPQEVGTNLVRLSESYEGLSIEKWSTSNAVTWMVQSNDG